jgi:hypothetical protein
MFSSLLLASVAEDAEVRGEEEKRPTADKDLRLGKVLPFKR